MQKQTVEYVDQDYDVAFEISQATLAMQFKYEGYQGLMLQQEGGQVEGRDTVDALEKFSRRYYYVHVLPAFRGCITKIENRDPEKTQLTEFTAETWEGLPSEMTDPLVEAVFELNKHWNPFFVKAKPTGSS
jgi:hypothetical protein